MWAQPIWGGTPSDLVFRDGSNEIVSGHVDRPGNPYETWGFKHLNRELIDALNIWARFIYGPLLDDRVLAAAGDVQGLALLHLQCATGEDTLSWAVAGARATGAVRKP